MLEIGRNEAITLVAYRDLLNMDSETRENILIDILSSEGVEDFKELHSCRFNPFLIEYLQNTYRGILNKYLGAVIKKIFNVDVLILGEPETLYPCPCCNYRTLEAAGDYFICKICYWEDDGTNNMNTYSSVNKMTLEEAKKKFFSYGVCCEKYIKSVDQEGVNKYGRQ